MCVEPALDHPNVTLLTNALVTRLDTSASGREVSAVQVERNGARETYSGSVVVVSAGAINSAALLLRSADDSRLSHLEHRVRPHHTSLAEVELDLARGGPRVGDVQAHGGGVVVPLPLVLDQRPELLCRYLHDGTTEQTK
ncbi:MAG: GMC family oxidoreductase [Nitrospiraceae bacterium]|nr:GMC family oxidoreductase [Nitrospiraceae bacterium]